MSGIGGKIVLFLHRIKNRILGIDSRSQLEIAVDNGLKIGKNCHIMGEVIIDPGHCFLIEIGDNVTIAPRCHILAHDASTKRELGYTVIGRVKIGDNCFIGAGTIVLPGVTVGKHCVVGAGSVVTKDVPDGSVAVGNPAKVISSAQAFFEKKSDLLGNSEVFDSTYTIGNISKEQIEEMKERLPYGKIGFIE